MLLGLGHETVQRVVAAGAGSIAQQVARRVIAPADHLVGIIVAQIGDECAVLPDFRAVARQVVGIVVRCAGRLRRPGQALQAVANVGAQHAAPVLVPSRCISQGGYHT